MRKFHGLSRVAPLALLLAGPAFAQTPPPSPDTAPPPVTTPPPSAPAPAPAATATAANGKIIGVVTDASTGKPVPGALVIATGPGGEQTAVTDAKGAFQISGLASGRYKLAVQLEGFNPAERADLDVKTDQTLRANLAVVPSAVQMEEVVVTGSRIRRKDLTTPAPVTVINTEQLAASGKVSVGDFLQTLPEQGSAVNTQVNNGGRGNTQVNLRGLSALRTLVLINGRRMVFTGIGGNTGTGVDLNMIPTSAIERIEVLKDGASAVYGSDAIAGVVNIITKKPYNGVDFGVFSGISQESDGFTYDLNATAGTSGDRGGALFSAGYFEQQSTWARNRDFSLTQRLLDTTTGTVYPYGSSRIPNGRVQLPRAERGVANGNTLWNQLVGANPTAGAFIYDPTGAGAINGWRAYNGGATGVDLAPSGDGYNYQLLNYNVTPQNRINLYSTGDYKLVPAVRAFYETSYVNRSSQQNGAPTPLVIGAGGSAVTISKDSIYNPFGRDFDQYQKRLVEFGPRWFQQDLDTFRAVGGFNGTLPVLNGWFWDTSLNYGRTTGIDQNRGELNTTRIQSAVGPSFRDANGVARCGTPAAPIANCVPLDLFHGVAITPDQAAYVGFTGVSRVYNELFALQANTSGELFRLLADRPVGLAVGYEYRVEAGADQPDPVTAAGESSGNNRKPTSGRFHVNEGYAELSVPVVSNLPFVADLEATAAARVFNYSTFGTDWTYKFGGRWRVIPDVTVRGTYSTAFRAPSINELYLGLSDNFPNLSDPCSDLAGASPALIANCTAHGVPATGSGDVNTQLRSRNGGSPNLKPETAKTWTIGTVLEPRAVKGLSITLDYYWIQLRQAISTFGAPFIVNNCYRDSGPGDAALCALVQRDSAGLITNITDTNVNVGGINSSGADLAVRYRLETRGYGAFGFGFDGTWLQKLDQIQPDGSLIRGAGQYDFSFTNGNNGFGGVAPRFKFNSGVTWGLKGLGAGVNMRFIGRFKECGDPADGTISGGTLCSDDASVSRYVSPYSIWDGFVSYDLASSAGKTGIALGVRNLFNTAPPVIYSSFTPQSDPTAYDFMGRFFYVNLSHRI